MFLATASMAFSQPPCERYNKHYPEGVRLAASGQYKKAIAAFNSAQCPSLTTVKKAEIQVKVKECQDKLNSIEKAKRSASKKPATTQAPVATKTPDAPQETTEVQTAEEPPVEVLYCEYLKATCRDGVRGVELMVTVFGRDLIDNRLHVNCVVSPKNGSGKVVDSSPLAASYTVEDHQPGQAQILNLPDGEVCASTTFFIPFSVMDFMGDYSQQPMNTDIFVYRTGESMPVAKYHADSEEGLAPYTITVNRRTTDCNIEAPYSGGVLDLDLAVCPGNSVVWTDLPYWIKSDEEGIHVTENPSTSPRSATIHVASTGGGNVVNVNISQKGRESMSATATVNKVWLEDILRDAENDIHQLNVHVDCEITGAKGKEIRVYAYFYCPDGTTPLLDENREPVVAYGRATSNYTETYFDNFPIAMWLHSVTEAVNNKAHEAKYYIKISEDGGESWIATSGPYTINW